MPGFLDLVPLALVRLCAAGGRFVRVAVPNACQNHKIIEGLSGETGSVLAERFGDPALGQFVLADDALGVDPQ